MANSELRFRPAPIGSLKRPRYESGKFIASKDLFTEQHYRLLRLRYHNRYLHGWGVFCGLGVVPARDPTRPWAVQICPGYAISCCGDEIEVLTPHTIDIRDYLWMQSRDHKGPAYVGIRYDEELRRPLPSQQPACSCEETRYEPSRIQDSFKVDALWTIPTSDEAKGFDMCTKDVAPCPTCTDCPYVFLARINLPSSESDPITRGHIDNAISQR